VPAELALIFAGPSRHLLASSANARCTCARLLVVNCDTPNSSFDDQPGITFLLSGDDMIDDHWTTSSDRFPVPWAPPAFRSANDWPVACAESGGPAEDLDVGSAATVSMLGRSVGPANSHGEIDAQDRQSRCTSSGASRVAGMDYVENSAFGIAKGIVDLASNRQTFGLTEPEYFIFCGGDFPCSQDRALCWFGARK